MQGGCGGAQPPPLVPWVLWPSANGANGTMCQWGQRVHKSSRIKVLSTVEAGTGQLASAKCILGYHGCYSRNNYQVGGPIRFSTRDFMWVVSSILLQFSPRDLLGGLAGPSKVPSPRQLHPFSRIFKWFQWLFSTSIVSHYISTPYGSCRPPWHQRVFHSELP